MAIIPKRRVNSEEVVLWLAELMIGDLRFSYGGLDQLSMVCSIVQSILVLESFAALLASVRLMPRNQVVQSEFAISVFQRLQIYGWLPYPIGAHRMQGRRIAGDTSDKVLTTGPLGPGTGTRFAR